MGPTQVGQLQKKRKQCLDSLEVQAGFNIRLICSWMQSSSERFWNALSIAAYWAYKRSKERLFKDFLSSNIGQVLFSKPCSSRTRP